MIIGKILVPVSSAIDDAPAIFTALNVAKEFGAHVTALFAPEDPMAALPTLVGPLSGRAMEAIIDGQAEIYGRKAAALKKVFAEATNNELRAATSFSFLEAVGQAFHTVGVAASLADLTVMRPAKADASHFEIISEVLMQGCPILLSSGVSGSYRRVAVGWNGSISAAHALSAAMPFLEKAEHVDLVCLRDFGERRMHTWDVDMYMRVHGINYSEHHYHCESDSADELCEYAGDSGADLLVVGGFGHSRIRETLFGGVTNELLANPPLPIFLTH